jgi:hypothetical protein
MITATRGCGDAGTRGETRGRGDGGTGGRGEGETRGRGEPEDLRLVRCFVFVVIVLNVSPSPRLLSPGPALSSLIEREAAFTIKVVKVFGLDEIEAGAGDAIEQRHDLIMRN